MTPASWSGPTGSGAAPGPAAPPTTSTTTTTSGATPVHGETPLFERLTLEAFQSGLSWLTILRKRPAFRDGLRRLRRRRRRAVRRARRRAADGRRGDRPQPAEDPGRDHQRRAPCSGCATAGGLDEVLWSFAPTEHTPPATLADVPATTPASVALAQGRSRGTGSSSSARRPCTPRCRRAGWWTTTCADATGDRPMRGRFLGQVLAAVPAVPGVLLRRAGGRRRAPGPGDLDRAAPGLPVDDRALGRLVVPRDRRERLPGAAPGRPVHRCGVAERLGASTPPSRCCPGC